MKNILYIVTLVSVMFMSCDDEILDINENPNLAAEGDVNLLLAGAQVASGFWTTRTANDVAMVLSNQSYRLGFGQYTVGPDDINNDWNGLYTNALKEFDQVILQGEESDLPGIAGIAKVYKAYLFSIMVDVWGDIPFSEALDGENNTTPLFDDDAAIYTSLLALLDEAKVNLDTAIARAEIPPTGDLVYGGSFANYRAVANTVKLRMYVNLRLVDPATATAGINDIVAEGDYIDTNAENFVFQFGPNVAPLDQHPAYQQDYTGAGGKANYMNNYFMYTLWQKNDPRIDLYLVRQASFSELTFDQTPCNVRTDCEFYNEIAAVYDNGDGDLSIDGLIGRDIGDPSGIPLDGPLRTAFGAYPMGGIVNDGSNSTANLAQGGLIGGGGAGVMPWLTAANTHFLLAEAALTLPGVTGLTASTLLDAGIDLSMDYVWSTSAAIVSNATGTPITPADAFPSINNVGDGGLTGKDLYDSLVDVYNTAILSDFGTATTNGQLDIVIEEKLFAEFGNGWDGYTDFRRTGFPSDAPESIVPLGPFPDRLPLSRSELTTNPNAPSPAPLVTDRVFWDVN